MSKPRAGVTAVGDHQPEDARVEIDHLFEVEGIEANVAKLGIGHRVHRRSPSLAVAGDLRAAISIGPISAWIFYCLYDNAVAKSGVRRRPDFGWIFDFCTILRGF